MKFFDWYWNDFLEKIITRAEDIVGYELIEPWGPYIVKGVITFFILLLIYEMYLRIRRFWRSRKFMAESTPVVPPSSERVDQQSEFIQQLESLKAPQQTIERLIKEKKYDQLGEVYVSMQKYKEAGWAFEKAGLLKRAATEYAKAGKTEYAAKLLLRANEPQQAVQLLVSINQTKKAGKWLEKKGFLDMASFIWWDLGYYKRAVVLWLKWLKQISNNPQEKSAFCNKIVQYIYKDGLHLLPKKYKVSLLMNLSQQMIQEKRYDLAVDLLRNCGEYKKAEKLLQEINKNR